MGKLISGKEAKMAWANGEDIEFKPKPSVYSWGDITSKNTLAIFDDEDMEFRFKPQTITLNGIEVPAPFKPKEGDWFYYINDEFASGYSSWSHFSHNCIAVWRTEDEIKQVVEALRSIFNVK